MHNLTKAPIAALCAAVAACLLATAVVADPAATPSTTTDATKPSGMTTGSVNVEESSKKQLADCMAIWEPRTHMTRQQWRRTCKSSLDDLPNL